MTHMSVEDFESRYRSDPDPWGYESSDYEREKYAATLRAAGPGPFARGLELGSSIGVLSTLLAPRCRELVCVDAAPTAVDAARRRLGGVEGVQIVLGAIPEAIPEGGYDLVVASEILYYLSPPALDATLSRLRASMDPGASLVAVHWRPRGDERPFTAAEIHDRLRAQPWLAPMSQAGTDAYLLDVLARR